MRISLIVASFFLPRVALAFSATVVQRNVDTRTSSGSTHPPLRHNTIPRGPWEERFQELLHFQREHGHCRVPKRYAANKTLANWVSKQRQERRRFHKGDKASITAVRIKALDMIGFCWNTHQETDASARELTSVKSETDLEEWQEQLQALVEYMDSNHVSTVSDLPKHSHYDCWIKRQRKLYQQQKHRKNNTNHIIMSSQKIRMLDQVDPHWHLNCHQLAWETRFQELVDYARQHGDCCVPISYGNKKLANWVSNQRKLYSEQLKGRKNSLDTYRKQRLDDIGFIWNRWDYEFDRKNVLEGPF